MESSHLLIIDWSFWWLAPIQEPTKICLINTKDTPITLGNSKGFDALCQESKTKLEQKMCLVLSSLRKL